MGILYSLSPQATTRFDNGIFSPNESLEFKQFRSEQMSTPERSNGAIHKADKADIRSKGPKNDIHVSSGLVLLNMMDPLFLLPCCIVPINSKIGSEWIAPGTSHTAVRKNTDWSCKICIIPTLEKSCCPLVNERFHNYKERHQV
jgi:hypothetical protein